MGVEHPWGVLPVMAYTGRLRPKRVPFSGFRYIKGYEFYLLKYIKGCGNLSFWSVKVRQGEEMHFMAVKKSRKGSVFVIYSDFKDSAFGAV